MGAAEWARRVRDLRIATMDWDMRSQDESDGERSALLSALLRSRYTHRPVATFCGCAGVTISDDAGNR